MECVVSFFGFFHGRTILFRAGEPLLQDPILPLEIRDPGFKFLRHIILRERQSHPQIYVPSKRIVKVW